MKIREIMKRGGGVGRKEGRKEQQKASCVEEGNNRDKNKEMGRWRISRSNEREKEEGGEIMKEGGRKGR